MLQLVVLNGEYWVCRFAQKPDDLNAWFSSNEFVSLTCTPAGEWSLVCETGLKTRLESTMNAPIPNCEGPFTLFRIAGTLAFSLTGILHRLTTPLAAAKVSIFALSTYDTDYLCIPTSQFPTAKAVLLGAGYTF